MGHSGDPVLLKHILGTVDAEIAFPLRIGITSRLPSPDLDREAVLAVFDCRFVAEAANVLFVGGGRSTTRC